MKIALMGLRSIGNCAGGIERHVEELAVRMADQGHEVTVFCRGRYNEIKDSWYKNIKLVDFPAIYSKHLEAISHTACSVLAALRGFDIVHIHACGPSLLSWIPGLFNRKVVVTVHGLDFMRAKWGGLASSILRAGAWTAVNCPDRTIVVSRELRDYYLKNYRRETIHIPNGVMDPEALILPPERIKRFGVKGKDYVLFLGRLVPEKGAHYLIKAFKNLDTDLKLLIVGGICHTDSYGENLLEMAQGDKRIVFTGPLYGEEKAEVFSNAKFFVLPSDLEGMPIVLLEAMSYGLPVLSSDIPECMEVFTAGSEADKAECDFIPADAALCRTFRAGDVDDLRSRMKAMIDGAWDLEELGQRARRHVLVNYNWDAITLETLEVYRSALGGNAKCAMPNAKAEDAIQTV